MKLISTAFCIAAAVLAAPAVATTYPITVPVAPGSYNSGFVTVGSGVLADSYTFNLGYSELGAFLANVNLALNQNIQGLTAELIRVSDSASLGTINTGAATSASSLTFATYAGAYRIDVTGTVANGLTGTYSLGLQQTGEPVPGPAGFLVAGAGVGLVAWSRRRKARAAAGALQAA